MLSLVNLSSGITESEGDLGDPNIRLLHVTTSLRKIHRPQEHVSDHSDTSSREYRMWKALQSL